jgi:hypothetical protein
MLRSIRLVPYLRFTAPAALVITQIFVAVSFLTGCAHCPWTPVGQSPPAADILQAGDLIWPRSPNGVVPYRVARNEGSTGDRKKWEKEKEEYLATLHAKSDLSPVERKRYKALQQMTYPDFVKRYFAPLPQETLEARGFASISVGHVGIIQIENGRASVIEATMAKGVRKVPYEKWIADQPDQLFWLSRLNNTSPDIRAAVAAIAESYLRRPYDFWNFDLRDDSCFYCSKLAWLAITKATSIPPDGKPNGDRVFWYSPKQLLCSRNLQSIVSSGNYTRLKKP